MLKVNGMPDLAFCNPAQRRGKRVVRTGSLKATVIVPANAGQALSMITEAMKGGLGVERSFTTPISFAPLENLAR